jgi:hypothetical protein
MYHLKLELLLTWCNKATYIYIVAVLLLVYTVLMHTQFWWENLNERDLGREA